MSPVSPPRAAIETPFHARTAALCQTNLWARWAGYTTVEVFSELELEYFAIRNQAALFDVSPMIKYRITGAEAEAYLDRLCTRDVRKIATGRVGYVVWCNDAGHVLDDGTLFHLAAQDYRLCCQERQLDWLLESAVGFEVTVEDETEAVAGLALQGPTSCAVLRALGLDGIEDLRPFDLRDFDLGGTPLLVSRTGFTGDLGYELWIEPAGALAIWDRLFEAGGQHGLHPIGARALDLARIEAGFIATNLDYVAADQAVRPSRGRSPFELGLGRLVDFETGHFTGRRALLAEREKGSRTCLVGLDIAGNKPASDALVYYRGKTEVGHITSAMWSPTCKANIALAMLRRPYGETVTRDLSVEIYVKKELKWARQMARCRVVPRPFFDHPRRRATPAGAF